MLTARDFDRLARATSAGASILGVTWIIKAVADLRSRRLPDGSWSYRQGGSPAAEATALAALALLETARTGGTPAAGSAELSAAGDAARWLARAQRADGSVPAADLAALPGWTTPHAILLWHRHGGFESSLRQARDWLVRTTAWSQPDSTQNRRVVGHDVTLVGWPWVAGTASWLEPTAMAVLALCEAGCGDHPRVAEGVRLIQDRALPDGGWNYGNPAVFGKALRPQPGPTGIALCALAAAGRQDDASVARGADYLRTALAATRSVLSVGWGVLGLTAVGARPPDAALWLEASAAGSKGRPDATLGMSLLILAGTDWARLLQPKQAVPGGVTMTGDPTP